MSLLNRDSSLVAILLGIMFILVLIGVGAYIKVSNYIECRDTFSIMYCLFH